MPAPINVTRTGTGWTVDVTALQLSTNLGVLDIYPLVNAVVISPGNFTKTSATLLTYVGAPLAANTGVQLFRDSLRDIPAVLYAQINSSAILNARFDAAERCLEDARQLLALALGGVFVPAYPTPQNGAYPTGWNTDTTFPPTRQSVFNALAGFATTGSLSAYATLTFVNSTFATITALSSYVTSTSLTSTLAAYLTLSAATSTYAPLASPTFTGTPNAPTPPLTDNGPRLATTGAVKVSNQPYVNAAGNVDQSCGHNTNTTLTFNTVTTDTNAAWTSGTTFTVPAGLGGLYEWYIFVAFPSFAPSVVHLELFVGGAYRDTIAAGAASGGGVSRVTGTLKTPLVAGDVCTVNCYQFTPGATAQNVDGSTAIRRRVRITRSNAL